MSITIIFGLPGAGKTALGVHFVNQVAYEEEDRLRMMQEEVKLKIKQGYKLTIPESFCFSTVKMTCQKFRRSDKEIYLLENAEDIFYVPPFAYIFIDETQQFFSSRRWQQFSLEESRFFEQHRHYDLDIVMIAQRYDLIDKNIRELAQFIEVEKKKNIYKKEHVFKRERKILGSVFSIRRYDNINDLMQCKNGGNRNLYKSEQIKVDYDVHALYDSQQCRDSFFRKFKTPPRDFRLRWCGA